MRNISKNLKHSFVPGKCNIALRFSQSPFPSPRAHITIIQPFPHHSISTKQSPLWWAVAGHEEMEWSSIRVNSDLTLGKGSSLRGWSVTGKGSPGHQAPSSRSMWTMSKSHGLVLDSPVRSWELNVVILMNPFQFEIFCDSMILSLTPS